MRSTTSGARFGVAEDRLRPANRRGPARCIRNNTLHVRMMVRWIGLVAGPEIEDAPGTAPITAAAPKPLPAGKPTHQHQFVGRGNVEALAIHLLTVDLDGLAQA